MTDKTYKDGVHNYFFGQVNAPIGVSIVVSNFHKQQFINECLESIKKQTYKNWEVIIIDDSNGADKVEEYVPGDMVDNIYSTNDIGLSRLRNFGATASKGRYLLFIDGDDKIHPEFLEKTVAVLDQHPEIGVAYTDTQHFDGADSFWEQPEYSFSSLLWANFICSCSLIRKKAYDEVGGYDERNFNYWEDYQFWIAMGAKGWYGKHIPKKLFYYRIHPESGMQSKRNDILAPLYKSYIVSKFPDFYPVEMVWEASAILNAYPPNIMSWSPQVQEQYLKEKGLI